MSTAVVSQNDALWSSEAVDSALGATAQAVSTATGTIYQVEVDNTANTSAASYVKVWSTAVGSLTVGTDAPIAIFPAPAGAKVCYTFPYGKGVYSANYITWACVTAAGTAGTSSPSASVVAKMIFS